jgi:hypothetical protein
VSETLAVDSGYPASAVETAGRVAEEEARPPDYKANREAPVAPEEAPVLAVHRQRSVPDRRAPQPRAPQLALAGS